VIVFVDDMEMNRTKFEEAAKYFKLQDRVKKRSDLPAHTNVKLRCLAPSDIPKEKSKIQKMFGHTILLFMDMDFESEGQERTWIAGQHLLLHLFDADPELCLRTIWITKTGMNALNEEYMRKTRQALENGDEQTKELLEHESLLPRSIVESKLPLPDADDPWWQRVWTEVNYVLDTCKVRQSLEWQERQAEQVQPNPDAPKTNSTPVEAFVDCFIQKLRRHGQPPYSTTLIRTILSEMRVDWYRALPEQEKEVVVEDGETFVGTLCEMLKSYSISFQGANGKEADMNVVQIRLNTNWAKLTGQKKGLC